MLIYLIGGRGCGKTTIGSLMAQQNNCKFVDLDEWLCDWQQAEIAEIVKKSGWPGFRALESQALRKVSKNLAQEDCAIIATGGGIILDSANRQYLKQNGLVFWLDASLEKQVARLSASPLNGQRPSLTGQDMLTELTTVMRERLPFYAEACHHRIGADETPALVCGRINALLRGN